MEIELKLAIAPDKVRALRAHPLLRRHATGSAQEYKLSDRYFDTFDLQFWKQGAGLRVRKAGGSWMQTLKGGGEVAGGLHRRHEWESPLNGPQPDFATLRQMLDAHSDWAQLLAPPDLEERLQCVFSVDFKRTVWLLRLDSGDEIELALDRGQITHGDRRLPLSEIELELKAGSPACLLELALELMDAVPLCISHASKAQHGYALHAPQTPTVVRAQKLYLPRCANVETGFRRIATNCLAQVQGNEAAVFAGNVPEGIHQMRVGLRRLRSALGLFGDLIPLPPQLPAEIAWLSEELAGARDWEVLLESTLPSMGLSAETDMEPLRAAMQSRAEAGRERARAALGSPRYARLAIGLSAWLADTGWRPALNPKQERKLEKPLRRFARQVLTQRHAVLSKRGRRLAHAEASQRHRLRIAAKKARYAAEFFQSLYGGKRLRTYIDALSRLQDTLGRLNDMAVADALLLEIQQSGSRAEAGAAGYARGRLAAMLENELARLVPRWKRFLKKSKAAAHF